MSRNFRPELKLSVKKETIDYRFFFGKGVKNGTIEKKILGQFIDDIFKEINDRKLLILTDVDISPFIKEEVYERVIIAKMKRDGVYH